jgi:hypothetical protein
VPQGFFYCADCGFDRQSLKTCQAALIELAQHFGTLFGKQGEEFVQTMPNAEAHPSQAFDQERSIGWHSDFSTIPDHPKLSFSYIYHADPACPTKGNWRFASTKAVLEHFLKNHDQQDVKFLKQPIFPFAYLGSKNVVYFPLIENNQLRFYESSLDGGLKLGRFPISMLERYNSLRKGILASADAVGQTYVGSRGALMVTHNGLALHDRLAKVFVVQKHREWPCYVLSPK